MGVNGSLLPFRFNSQAILILPVAQFWPVLS